MPPRIAAGQLVRTPLGTGRVSAVRGHGRLLVEIHGRSVIVSASDVAAVDAPPAPPARRRSARVDPPAAPAPARGGAIDVDLHGLTVEEALERAERALNDALLDDRGQLRLIHGRRGGRIRAALHRRLRAIPAVRAFRIDPRNAGVTIVEL